MIKHRKELLEILYTYGIEHQIDKFREEVNEVLVELSLGDKAKIQEELADVQNVLNQLKMYYDETIIEQIEAKKIKRTLSRIASLRG